MLTAMAWSSSPSAPNGSRTFGGSANESPHASSCIALSEELILERITWTEKPPST
jgi:hypothetical protein